MTQDSKPHKRYERWHALHGTSRNERRREAYADDPQRREKNAARARQWRLDRAQGQPITRVIHRSLNGKRVQVWSLGQIADETGYAPNTLRRIAAHDLFPQPLFPGPHRYYTAAQVKVIKTLLAERRR